MEITTAKVLVAVVGDDDEHKCSFERRPGAVGKYPKDGRRFTNS